MPYIIITVDTLRAALAPSVGVGALFIPLDPFGFEMAVQDASLTDAIALLGTLGWSLTRTEAGYPGMEIGDSPDGVVLSLSRDEVLIHELDPVAWCRVEENVLVAVTTAA